MKGGWLIPRWWSTRSTTQWTCTCPNPKDTKHGCRSALGIQRKRTGWAQEEINPTQEHHRTKESKGVIESLLFDFGKLRCSQVMEWAFWITWMIWILRNWNPNAQIGQDKAWSFYFWWMQMFSFFYLSSLSMVEWAVMISSRVHFWELLDPVMMKLEGMLHCLSYISCPLAHVLAHPQKVECDEHAVSHCCIEVH